MIDQILKKMMSAGLLDEQGRQTVRQLRSQGRSLDAALLQAVGDEPRLMGFLSEEFAVPIVELTDRQLDKKLLGKYPARILMEHKLLPLEEHNGTLTVVTSRLFDTAGVDELRVASGRQISLALASTDQIDKAMKTQLGIGAETIQSLESDAIGQGIEVINEDLGEDLDGLEAAEDASIIKFVNQVLAQGIEQRATDVHFEPFEDQLRVRYRIDGVLVEANIPASVGRFRAAIVSRLKILSQLDIAEKRLPQDGRIKLKIAGREIDVRVSVIPMLHGEAVVLRILDRSATLLGMEHLGMSERDTRVFKKVLDLPHGIILVTGPTGSGKTTTLYAGLSTINTMDNKIVTIEDPVEYQLTGVNQIQVSEKTGLTFAKGLRAILRHDPDIVLIGEIRDQETANIAVQASLTGHLVFSTLHTNDAPGATTRLIDMGVEPYLVASTVEMILAQRLVRLICKNCRESIPIHDAEKIREEFGADVPDVLYKGRGCEKCQGTGYRGRQGIFEMMEVTDEIRDLVLERRSSQEIRRMATRQGMKSLREDGWRLIREGKTTLEEVLRMTKDERYSMMTGQKHDAPAEAK